MPRRWTSSAVVSSFRLGGWSSARPWIFSDGAGRGCIARRTAIRACAMPRLSGAGTGEGPLWLPRRTREPRQVERPHHPPDRGDHSGGITRPKTEPIVHLASGPGGIGLGEIPFLIRSGLNRNHDLIVMDQRGTFLSKPALTCEVRGRLRATADRTQILLRIDEARPLGRYPRTAVVRSSRKASI